MEHLFYLCHGFIFLWSLICCSFNVPWVWDNSDLSGFLLYVESHPAIPLECALHCLWVVWCTRNDFIFQGRFIDFNRVVKNILSSSALSVVAEPKRCTHNLSFPCLDMGDFVEFFYGAE